MEEKIAVLIPCYNEEMTIGKVIDDFKKELPNAEIYVYDNNSSDNTSQIAAEHGAHVKIEPRQGKGNVVRSMFMDIDAEYYIMVDGDDTYPAEYVHKLIEPMKLGLADMTIGDRLTNGTYANENKRHFHDFGNNLVKTMINWLYQSNIQDIMTGYRGFNRYFVKTFPAISPGFEIETELTIHSVEHKFLIKEIEIDYRDRPEGSESKLNTFSDGFKVIRMILSMLRDSRPLYFFGILSLIFGVLGLIAGVPVVSEFIHSGYIEKLPSAILAVGLILVAIIAFFTGVILDTNNSVYRKNYRLELMKYKTINKKK